MRIAPVFALGLAVCTMPAFAAFKCVDEKGRTHFGETMPDACANVVTYETNKYGAVIRKYEPTTAGDALATRKGAAEAEKANAEQKRRDRAILDSYSSAEEIDTVRNRNVEMINSRLKISREALEKARVREEQVQKLVTSKGPNVSAELKGDFDRARSEHAAAKANVVRLEKDLETAETRFAYDKKRYLELRGTK